MGNKIHFTSLGCARNLVDTEVMLGTVLKAGFEVTEDFLQADYIVVNTCGFLASARDEALSILDELFAEKKKQAKVIVTGCMVSSHKKDIESNFPKVHYYLGSGDVDKILEAIDSDSSGEEISDRKSFLQQGEIPRMVSTPGQYAYLKIAEGCKKRCSFCIIPHIKGSLRSKSEEQVLKEFQILLQSGIEEVILIAQDLGDYGKDRKDKEALYSLLKNMLAVPGDYWIRLLYLYPDEITDQLIEIIKSDPRICRYLDMPIQHINDEVLKAMHRKTNRAHIISTIEKLRKEIPDIVIRTSLMVGFPGETEEQFQELVDFVKTYKLDNIGIFTYSNEDESYSAKLPGHLPDDVKQERLDILAKAQQEAIKEKNQKWIGKELDVFIEEYHPESPYLMQGRFYGQCPDIDGNVIINDGRIVSQFGKKYRVRITDAMEYDLIGTALEPLFEKPKLQLV